MCTKDVKKFVRYAVNGKNFLQLYFPLTAMTASSFATLNGITDYLAEALMSRYNDFLCRQTLENKLLQQIIIKIKQTYSN